MAATANPKYTVDAPDGPPAVGTRPTRVRFGMLGLILMATTLNYIDRSNLSIVAPLLSKQLKIDDLHMGWLLSAFAWSYAIATLPGGGIVDRLGVRWIYGLSQLVSSIATFLLGFASGFAGLFALRLAVGLSESPAFPANNRVVTTWFPQRQRGMATGAYVMGQYIGTGVLAPGLLWMAVFLGWRSVFFATGALGIIGFVIWMIFYRDPLQSTRANQAELAEITAGGGLTQVTSREKASWAEMGRLCLQRQIVAICIGKFAIVSSIYFLLTWFPTYLVKQRGMTILGAGIATSLPYLAATIGVFLGGCWSDWLLKRGATISLARKVPIVTGFICATSIVLANHTTSNVLAVGILTFAYFAQGVSSTSWSIVAEVAPRQLIAFTGGVCNCVGNLAGIATPIAIGFILHKTHSFEWVLAAVGVMGVLGAFCYTVLLGPIYRIELT